jgi:sulfur-oxidizing protein SoxX
MKYLFLCMFTAVVATLSGCESGPESPRGFSLPKGDASNGRWYLYSINACHAMS